jgi:hypothetical protein
MNIPDLPALVEMANANDAIVMDGSMDPVREIVADNDVEIAIWQDVSRPQGIGLMVIKSDDVMRAAVTNQRAFRGKVAAIKCVDAEQAMALLADFGARGSMQ